MTLATTFVVRLLVAVIAVLAVVGQVAHLDALSGATLGLAESLTRNPRPSFMTLVAADAVVSAVASVLAVMLVFRGDPNRGARGLGVALAAWSYLIAYSGVVILLRPDPGVLRSAFEAHFSLIELLGLAGIIHFTAVFPRRLTPGDLSAPESLPVGLRTLQATRQRLLSAAAPWVGVSVLIVALLLVNMLGGRSVADAALNPLMDVVRFLAVGVVVLNLRRSWMVGAREERANLGWIFVGLALLVSAIVLLIGGNILLSSTGWSEPAVAWRPILLDMGLVGFLWGLSMGVFYRGAMNSLAAAFRVVALASLALSTIFIATGLEVLLSGGLVGRASLPAGIGTVIAVVLTGFTFGRTLPFIEHLLKQIPAFEEDGITAS